MILRGAPAWVYEYGITGDDLLECAQNMSLRERKAKEIIDEVYSVVTQWESFAQTADVPEQQASAIARELIV